MTREELKKTILSVKQYMLSNEQRKKFKQYIINNIDEFKKAIDELDQFSYSDIAILYIENLELSKEFYSDSLIEYLRLNSDELNYDTNRLKDRYVYGLLYEMDKNKTFTLEKFKQIREDFNFNTYGSGYCFVLENNEIEQVKVSIIDIIKEYIKNNDLTSEDISKYFDKDIFDIGVVVRHFIELIPENEHEKIYVKNIRDLLYENASSNITYEIKNSKKIKSLRFVFDFISEMNEDSIEFYLEYFKDKQFEILESQKKKLKILKYIVYNFEKEEDIRKLYNVINDNTIDKSKSLKIFFEYFLQKYKIQKLFDDILDINEKEYSFIAVPLASISTEILNKKIDPDDKFELATNMIKFFTNYHRDDGLLVTLNMIINDALLNRLLL